MGRPVNCIVGVLYLFLAIAIICDELFVRRSVAR